MSGKPLRKKETRKVVQTGNSLGVGLPKAIIDSLNIARGDEIEFEVKDDQIILNKKRKWEDEVDIELVKMLAETLDEHDQVFKKLRDR
ncbi:AbrB/MazE/SpoVT family DNA-binding domain-containing protein [Thalassobacillus devorans]|uniref:AbrB/MazE/SpoVT family DNA-binding domain-containing protein n=1 Tax=Thalassobacillus devorans TaxID=279813 RepID=UPI00048A6537|nr:AbrB/MazE/SpoVT family DNA-binding domain-containing protein [Thalassobacillus devorans]